MLNFFFFQKWLNILEQKFLMYMNARSGISWIGRKLKFKIFPIYIFRRYHLNLRWIFQDNLKNKNLRFFKILFFILFSTLSSSIKTGSKLRGGGLHILIWEKPIFRICALLWKLFFGEFFFVTLFLRYGRFYVWATCIHEVANDGMHENRGFSQ